MSEVNFEIKDCEKVKGATYVGFNGIIDTNTVGQVEEQFNKLVDDEITKVVLDFKNLSFISSAGLGSIMALSEDIEDIDEDEGWVKLINLSEDIKEIFDTMGFSDLLDIYTDEADMLDDID